MNRLVKGIVLEGKNLKLEEEATNKKEFIQILYKLNFQ